MTWPLILTLWCLCAMPPIMSVIALRKMLAPSPLAVVANSVGFAGFASVVIGLATFNPLTEQGLGLILIGLLGIGIQSGVVGVISIAATVFKSSSSPDS